METPQTRRQFLEYAASVMGLGAALSACQSLKAIYSTPAEQRAKAIANQGADATAMAERQHKPYIVTETGILLTTLSYLQETASLYPIGLEERFYNHLLPGNAVKIVDPDTGSTIDQLVSAAWSIDTKWGRINVANLTIDALDEEIEKRAGKSLIVTQQYPSPYSTGFDIITLGWARYFDPFLTPPSGVIKLPSNLFNFVTVYGIGVKAEYLAVAIPRGSPEASINGILAFAPMGRIASADSRYNIPLRSDYNVVVGSRDTLLENIRQAIGWIGGLGRDITAVSGDIRTFLQDIDSIEKLHQRPHKDPLTTFVEKSRQVNEALDNIDSIRSNITPSK